MAATQRTANASAAARVSAEPGETTIDQGDGEEGLDEPGLTGEVELPRVTLKFSAQAPPPPSRKGTGWHSKVNSGQLLYYNDVEELGKNRCTAYLRRMGKTVSNTLASDAVAMRHALREALSARNVGPGQAWSAARDTDGEEPPQTEGGAEPEEKAAEEGSRSGEPVATCSPRTTNP